MGQDVFDIRRFDEYKEDNRREVKNAIGGLPHSLWETYFAMANSRGGVIILGVGERQDGTWYVAGLQKKDIDKMLKNFWSTIHDRKKVNINLLTDDDMETHQYVLLHAPELRDIMSSVCGLGLEQKVYE